jgi:RNA polymerase sigma factor (sigma-70 family)
MGAGGEMMSEPLRPVLRYLRQAAGHRPAEDGDAPLLGRFLAGDGDAFAEVVRRHGPSVWAACRRILGEQPDAEDAFQATFLVLLRKAGSLRQPELVGPWLYAVACRTARKARALRGRRQERERPLAGDVAGEEGVADAVGRDLRGVLDEEVGRLPERFRVPFVWCCLGGLSHAEAARRLGCAKGTIDSRVARARERLRGRLARRGVTLSAAGLATALAGERTLAVPLALLETTAGSLPGRASPFALSLMEGVLHGMFLNKLKMVAVVVLALGLVGSGVGYFLPGRTPGPGLTPEARAEPPAPKAPEKPARKPATKPARGAEVIEIPPSREEIQKALKSRTKFPGIDDAKVTLAEALDQLTKIYDVRFDVQEKWFQVDQVMDVLKTEVANPNPIPAMNATLEEVLGKILSHIPVPSGATYLVRKDHIEITTGTAVRSELGRPTGSFDPFGGSEMGDLSVPPLPPLVVQKFEGTPLPEALDKIAESADVNVLLDPRAEGVDTVKVRARLYNVPADTAVRLLADMAGLGVARVDNVLYVTTPENAQRLQKAQATPPGGIPKEAGKPADPRK